MTCLKEVRSGALSGWHERRRRVDMQRVSRRMEGMPPGEFAWAFGILYNKVDFYPKSKTKRKAVLRRSLPSASVWVWASQPSLNLRSLPTRTLRVIKGKENKLIIFSYIIVAVFLCWKIFPSWQFMEWKYIFIDSKISLHFLI